MELIINKRFGSYCSSLKYVSSTLLVVSKTRCGICPSGLSGQVKKDRVIKLRNV